MSGYFITLEGGEGAGKSTLLKGLSSALTARGVSVETTREPGGTPLAESVRNLVLSPPDGHDWSPLASALLMNAARSDHIERLIRPALDRGDWVISDRFSDSTRVYQSVDGGVPKDQLLQLEILVTSHTRPDLTLILDAAPERLVERRAERGGTDVYERRGLEFHEAVRSAFLTIAEEDPARCVVLDALAEPQRLLERALGAIDRRLN